MVLNNGSEFWPKGSDCVKAVTPNPPKLIRVCTLVAYLVSSLAIAYVTTLGAPGWTAIRGEPSSGGPRYLRICN